MKRPVLLAFVLLFGIAPAAAQVSSVQTDRPAKKAKDPNAKRCEIIEVTGSRLGSRRICMTEEQWAQQRRDNRTDLERAQQDTAIQPTG